MITELKPYLAQPLVIPSTTYLESLCNAAEVGLSSEFSASTQAINSIRLLVVKRYLQSNPHN